MLEQKIEELTAAVTELTEAMRAFANAAPATGAPDNDDAGEDAAPKKRGRRGKKATADDDGGEKLTLEEVRAVAKQIIDNDDAEGVRDILKKFKLGKLTDAKPAQYAELKAAFEAHLAEGGDDDGEDDGDDDLI